MVEKKAVTNSENETNGEIRIQNVKRIFKDGASKTTVALDNVDLDIKPGEFVSLVGPSGCGKSTLLRLITGLDFPSEGEIYLDDKKITGPSYERGLVFQDPTLFPWLTVHDNVASGLVARKIYKNKKQDVSDFIKLVDLGQFEHSYPHQLSGGMAQRVSLARALVNHPKVLLLDEPLGALDAFTRIQMQDEILKLWEKRGTTMIFVTHDVDEAIYLSDRIVIMTTRPGRIQKVIDVKLPRPRERNDAEFLELRTKIFELLHLAKENVKPEYYI